MKKGRQPALPPSIRDESPEADFDRTSRRRDQTSESTPITRRVSRSAEGKLA